MKGKFVKISMCSIGLIALTESAMACDNEARDERSAYVVYEVPVARPQSVRYTTHDYYTCTAEYRQTIEYSRTAEYHVTRPCPVQRPMCSIRYAYVDP